MIIKGKKIRQCFILYLLMASLPVIATAQLNNFDANSTKARDHSALVRLQQENIEERYLALSDMNNQITMHSFNNALIEQILFLAERERKYQESLAKGELGEGYLSQLIEALGNTKDPRAIPYLLGYLGSGTAVASSLYKIGEPAVAPLIQKLQCEIVGYRSSAAYALGLFLKSERLVRRETREMIKQALIRELDNPRNDDPRKDTEWYEFRAQERANVRLNIAKALGYLAETSDKEVLPIIESLAKEDPYYLDMSKKKDYKGPQMRYLVREEAQEILNQLKEKGIQK